MTEYESSILMDHFEAIKKYGFCDILFLFSFKLREFNGSGCRKRNRWPSWVSHSGHFAKIEHVVRKTTPLLLPLPSLFLNGVPEQESPRGVCCERLQCQCQSFCPWGPCWVSLRGCTQREGALPLALLPDEGLPLASNYFILNKATHTYTHTYTHRALIQLLLTEDSRRGSRVRHSLCLLWANGTTRPVRQTRSPHPLRLKPQALWRPLREPENQKNQVLWSPALGDLHRAGRESSSLFVDCCGGSRLLGGGWKIQARVLAHHAPRVQIPRAHWGGEEKCVHGESNVDVNRVVKLIK